MASAQPQPFDVPKQPREVWKGNEIVSLATERLVDQYVNDLRPFMERFYQSAGLAELIFLHDAMLTWDQDFAGVITRRCAIADVLLSKLGYYAEGCDYEQVRYYEPSRQEHIAMLKEEKAEAAKAGV